MLYALASRLYMHVIFAGGQFLRREGYWKARPKGAGNDAKVENLEIFKKSNFLHQSWWHILTIFSAQSDSHDDLARSNASLYIDAGRFRSFSHLNTSLRSTSHIFMLKPTHFLKALSLRCPLAPILLSSSATQNSSTSHLVEKLRVSAALWLEISS